MERCCSWAPVWSTACKTETIESTKTVRCLVTLAHRCYTLRTWILYTRYRKSIKMLMCFHSSSYSRKELPSHRPRALSLPLELSRSPDCELDAYYLNYSAGRIFLTSPTHSDNPNEVAPRGTCWLYALRHTQDSQCSRAGLRDL